MGRAGQRNGAGAMFSMEKKKAFSNQDHYTRMSFGQGGEITNKQKPALTVLKQLISTFWKGMVGTCLDVQK